jgi:hypothetical protein
MIVPWSTASRRQDGAFAVSPRQFWSSPRFKQINRQLTLMWGLVFLVMMVSHVIAGAIDTRRGNTIFNWVAPIVLIVWAVKRTGEVSAAEAE